MLEREVSSSNGLPRWLTTTSDPQVGFEVDTIQDSADVALEEWDEKNSGKKKPKGTIRYAIPTSLDGSEIEGGLARERLLQEAEKAAGNDPDDPSAGLDIERRMPRGGYDPTQYG